jgi:hypothetical protein
MLALGAPVIILRVSSGIADQLLPEAGVAIQRDNVLSQFCVVIAAIESS